MKLINNGKKIFLYNLCHTETLATDTKKFFLFYSIFSARSIIYRHLAYVQLIRYIFVIIEFELSHNLLHLYDL